MVVGTGISCVALIFVRPGRPSNAGSKTKEQENMTFDLLNDEVTGELSF
jgi:hypothetical protein